MPADFASAFTASRYRISFTIPSRIQGYILLFLFEGGVRHSRFSGDFRENMFVVTGVAVPERDRVSGVEGDGD